MKHEIELVDCNTVLVAYNFNISLINIIWLSNNKIFTEEELKRAISIPVMLEIQSPDKFKFNLVADRLQFSVSPTQDNKAGLIIEKVGKLVETLPHTPYSAVGLNFVYHVIPTNNIEDLSKSLFFNNNSEIHKAFDNENSRLGGYFSTDKLGGRLRLDIKPVKINISNEKTIEKMQFSYNFNFSIDQENGANKVIQIFKKWDEAYCLSNELTAKVNPGA